MKILHYIATYAPAWKWGGPVVSTTNLCESLARSGHEVTVFTTDAGLETWESKNGQRNGVHVYYFPHRRRMGIASPELESAVCAHAALFDILHVTGVWQRTSPAACRAARANQIPYVISPRGALGPYSWGQKRWKKTLYYWLHEKTNLRGAAGLHFTSQFEQLECARFVKGQHTAVIPNSIDLTRWRPDPNAAEAWRQRHGLPSDVPLLLSVGRLHHKKGLELLPPALTSLRQRPWVMVFVGENEGARNELESSFAQAELADRVRFLPPHTPDELVGAYSAAQLFLLPSRHENFANVVVEALACGLPSLLSDCIGVAREILPSEGIAVEKREPALWTAAIARFLDKSTPLPPIESLSRWARARFDPDRLAAEMASFYREILSARSRAADKISRHLDTTPEEPGPRKLPRTSNS